MKNSVFGFIFFGAMIHIFAVEASNGIDFGSENTNYDVFVDNSKSIVVDVGLNNGLDTKHFLRDGHSVISVDANPLWIRKARKHFSRELADNKLILLNRGLANSSGSLTFHESTSSTRSSFDHRKATKYGTIPLVRSYEVPVIACEDIIKSVTKQIYFIKIDIEEFDYHCIEGISKRLPGDYKKPRYVSWENHFRNGRASADGWPAFDMNLIISMAKSGYDQIKMSYGSGGTYFGDEYPDEIIDCRSGNRAWRSIADFVKDGIFCPKNASTAGYWDFSMKYSKS